MHLVRLFRLAKQGTDELRTYLNAEADAVLDQTSDPISPERLREGELRGPAELDCHRATLPERQTKIL